MKYEQRKIGQRWLWDCPSGLSYVVEIIEHDCYNTSTVQIVQLIRQMESYKIGYVYNENFGHEYWTYLNGQDKP